MSRPESRPISEHDPIVHAVADFLARRARAGERAPQSMTVSWGEDAQGRPAIHVMAWADGKPAAQAVARI